MRPRTRQPRPLGRRSTSCSLWESPGDLSMIYASARGNRYERVRCPNWPRLAAGNRDTPGPPATPCCLQRLAAVGANLWRLGCVASWPRLLRAINRRAFAMQTTRSPPATPTASRTPGRQDMSQMKAVEGRFACN